MKGISHMVVWITGASSGIGEALTYLLNKEGCRLIISSRNKERLQEVKNQCENQDLVVIEQLDLADHLAMDSHVKNAVSYFGEVNILVNNAGVSQRSLISHTSIEVYQKLIDVNYMGTVALTKALLPYFISENQGHFVTVTSLMGKFGSPLRSGYCASKHALHGFFDVLRMEHEKDGISVTLVCPGFVNTEIALNALTADSSAQGTNDERTANGMPPSLFASKMLKAIIRKKHEVYIGGREISGVYLKRFFPKILHKVVLRSRVV